MLTAIVQHSEELIGVNQHNLALRHKRYELITLDAVDDQHKAPKYCPRLITGHLEDIAEPAHAIISKKRPGENFPKYFACTDTSLSIETCLQEVFSVSPGLLSDADFAQLTNRRPEPAFLFCHAMRRAFFPGLPSLRAIAIFGETKVNRSLGSGIGDKVNHPFFSARP